MWSLKSPDSDTTTVVTVPTDGIISVTKPDSVTVYPYVNGAVNAVHHVHVKEGDSVYFILRSSSDTPVDVDFDYNGITSTINVPAAETETPETYYSAPIMKEEIMTPAESINLFTNPGSGNMGGAIGGGLGAGVLGGVLGGVLLNNRGLGGVADGGVVTPALLASSLAQVTDTNMATTVLQSLGDIKAAIPFAESQVQLALAVAQADINRTVTNGQASIVSGQSTINKNVSDAIAASLASQGAIKETVLSTGAANLTATLNSKFELAGVIRDDGDKTRALITAQNDANLNRELAIAQAALLEQRAIGRSRDVEVNVTQTVSQNQAQLQAQAQQQQQFLITNNLLQSILSQAQIAQATNQQLIIGNSGTTLGGAQTANPVNVRA